MLNRTALSLVCSIAILLLLSGNAYARSITGKIVDENQQALPFVNILLQGSQTGTVSNEDGGFQIEVPETACVIEFHYLGYKHFYQSIKAGTQSQDIQISMEPRVDYLQEAIINSNSNPADSLMRLVIENRSRYNIESSDYHCKVYIKGLQRAKDVPDRFLGVDIDKEELGLDTNGNGIVYLFESLNALQHKKEGKYQETVLSSRVSGDNSAFSYTRASVFLSNYNKNLVRCVDMDRGVISPYGSQAFFYYHFHLDGSFYEGDQKYYRISYSPKRKHDPAGTGILIIRDELFYVQTFQMQLTRLNQLGILDTLNQSMEYRILNGHYLPASNQLTFSLNVYGIGLQGYFLTSFMEYSAALPSLPEKRPKMEVLRIEQNENSQDTQYWSGIRPIPLEAHEQRDFVKKDSVRLQKENKQDSLNSKADGMDWDILWVDYNRPVMDSPHYRFELRSLRKSVQFNTVDGLVLEPQFRFYQRMKGSNDLKQELTLKLRYGFSSGRLGGSFQSMIRGNWLLPVTFTGEIAHMVTPLDGNEGMNETWNSIYTLVLARNHQKFYQSSRIKAGLNFDVANGFELGFDLWQDYRSMLENNKEWSIRGDNTYFTSNTMLGIPRTFPDHLTSAIDLNFKFTPFNRYISSPKGRINLGSKWPTFSGTYTHTLPVEVQGIEISDFSRFHVQMDWRMRAGILGTTQIAARYGQFLHNEKTWFPDYASIKTNPFIFQRSSNRMLTFQSMMPYLYNTTNAFAQVHVLHHFDGFLLNKLPGIRNIRTREFVSFQMMATKGSLPYYEISFGLDNLALYKKDPGLLRLELYMGGQAGNINQVGLRLGLSF